MNVRLKSKNYRLIICLFAIFLSIIAMDERKIINRRVSIINEVMRLVLRYLIILEPLVYMKTNMLFLIRITLFNASHTWASITSQHRCISSDSSNNRDWLKSKQAFFSFSPVSRKFTHAFAR